MTVATARPTTTHQNGHGQPAAGADTGRSSRHPSRASGTRGQSGQRQHRRLIGNYQLGKTLGAGSMGKVKLAQHVITGKKVSFFSNVYIYSTNT
jgi:hypothetical protein